MDKDGVNKLLEEARKSLESRTRWHHKMWRWIRNRCPLCDAKMELKFNALNSVKTCSRCPNYHPYAGELNFVPILLVALVIMAIIILVLVVTQREKKAREVREIYREPVIRPRDGFTDGFKFD